MTHEVFSLVFPVKPPAADSLRHRLNPTGDPRQPIPGLDFRDLPMVHFAGAVVFDGREVTNSSGKAVTTAPLLVFECCIDGTRDAFFDNMLAIGEPALIEILSHCVDFDTTKVRTFIADAVAKPGLFHIGNPDIRVEHVKAGVALRAKLDCLLNGLVAAGRGGDPPLEIVGQLRQTLNVPGSSRQSAWHWNADRLAGVGGPAWFSDGASRWLSRLGEWSLFLIGFLGAGWLLYLTGRWLYDQGPLVFLAGLIGAGVLVLALWRWLVGRHAPAKPDVPLLHELQELEDRGITNHMASLVLLKPGFLRRISIRAVLFFLNRFYRTIFTDITPGRILGLHTIHFAQWTIVDLVNDEGKLTGREGLMFLSNYDASWDSYLDDFVTELFNGVVSIWANGETFPWPLDGPTFKTWARNQMSPWQHWYRAYDISVANIENNDAIRAELVRGVKSDEGARRWLERFGSSLNIDRPITPPPGRLDATDIQGLVVSSYRHLPFACYVLLRLDDRDGQQARAWLHTLIPRITDARDRSREELAHEACAINVAFTETGLSHLGLDSQILDGFPLAFREGMAPIDRTHRSRALGDVGGNAPQHWDWGYGTDGRRTDVLLMAFGRCEHALRRTVSDLLYPLTNAGAASVVADVPAHFIPAPPGVDPIHTIEHFGFVDGLSQPILEGTRQAKRTGIQDAQHLVKAGEFVMGYPTNDGPIASGVPVPVSFDPQGLLPPTLSNGNGFHDLGRNGTYLVCRQMHQDVARFREFTARAAGTLSATNATQAGGAGIAAHIVGRWRDGVPLEPVRGRNHASGAPGDAGAGGAGCAHASGQIANGFLFSHDPYGTRCPIGAHIRRANPRDSLLSKPAAALVAANRRRLMRRGRPYGEELPQHATEDDGQPRGLMFMCLNGDIERQFEFVQQNWINGSGFSGLYDERDPLIGTKEPVGRETIQTQGVRERIERIPPFVAVKGGGYFFMPGLSALRYLASNGRLAIGRRGVGIAVPAPSLPSPPLQVPSFVRQALTQFEWLLSVLRVVWAARYPLLIGAVLACLPLSVAVPSASTSTTSLFLANGWTGVFFVSLVASIAAFVVMINLRLALMYGWRVGLERGVWLTETTWWQLFAFQALAAPVIITCIWLTAADWTEAHGGSMLSVIWRLAPAAIGGCASALLALMLATTVQASRQGSRPDLFFPPNRLFAKVAGPDWRGPKVHAFSRWLSRIGVFFVDNVPPALGYGYIDYRHRLILPGHVFAAVLAGIVAALYVAFGWILQPATGRANGLPPVGYLLFIMIIAGWILSATAFLLDRYRFSTVLAVSVWLVLAAAIFRTDHFFEVRGPLATPGLSAADVVRAARARHRAGRMVIVAAEGQGITSSAWTAKVLTNLTDRFHADFTDSLTLVTSASGASLGAFHFLDRYERTGFTDTSDVLQEVVSRASAPSSGDVAWGFAYPDLLRAFVPIVVPAHVDRGWAMEYAWRRQLGSRQDPTLCEWRRDVGEGWRPASAFGVTVVETGSRAMLATYDLPPGAGDGDVTGKQDISMITAARLSSGFPFISPVPQAQLPSGSTGLHLADGGYWDNYGIVAAIDWLRAVEPVLCDGEPVLLIQILSSPPITDADRAPKNNTWTLDLTGPVQTLIGVRYNAQPSRNQLELDLLDMAWHEEASQGGNKPKLLRVVFRLDDRRMPLSWNLGEADARYLDEAWRRNSDQLEDVRKFLFREKQ